MRAGILIVIFWCVSLQSQAGLLWNYELSGTVTGSAEAAGYLADIDVGDPFTINMMIGKQADGNHEVSFNGTLGGWSFSRQKTEGYYAAGDFSPERFYTPGSYSPLNAPEGTGGPIVPLDIYILIFGQAQTGTVNIPEEDRLIKNTGWLDVDRFLGGSLSFNFYAMLGPDDHRGVESDLFGEITSIVTVPEPSSVVILLFGLLGLWRTNQSQRYKWR